MHDMGEAHYVLGMKITRDRAQKKLWLSQESYTLDMIQKFGMKDCKAVATPTECGQK